MLQKRPFGNTGHMSTVTLFGAAALGSVSQDDADRTLEVLLEYGVNHIDVAASYGDAELRIGPWMAQHRKDFFLATKTGERTYQEAKDEIHKSLDRLQTDQIDLIQLHGLIMPNEWDVAMGTRWRARSGCRGAGSGAGALHRRHRPQLEHRRHAHAQHRPLRLRFGAAALQLCDDAQRAVRPGFRKTGRPLPRAQYRRADHQVHRPWTVGYLYPRAQHMVSAAGDAR